MPKSRVTVEALLDSAIGPKGKYAVGELIVDSEGVPMGTRGVITFSDHRGHIFVYPHSVRPQDEKLFKDGHVQVVPKERMKVVGRVSIR